MITNPSIFEDGYLPGRLPHRDSELGQLERALEPATRGQPAEDVLIAGRSGVGKTVLAQFALERLAEAADIEWGYVRCLGRTGGTILRRILRDHPGVDAGDVHQNTPIDDLRQMLQAAGDDPFVVVLDEGDDLPDTEALDLLSANAAVSVIAICHNPDRWRARLDADQAGGWTADRQVDLGPYGTDELATILQHRARSGLPLGVIDRGQLEDIADTVAGNAREGIQSLRAAARLADERGHVRILEADIEDCYGRARQRIRKQNLRSLPFHHQVLYALVFEGGPGGVAAEALHDRYDAVADQVYHGSPKDWIEQRGRRQKLQKLIDYDLVEQEGSGYGAVYRAADREIEARVDLPAPAE